MGTPRLRIRPGHPDFLDLPWGDSLVEWNHPRRLHLPKGISRHEVRFFGYESGIYAVKELPAGKARRRFGLLCIGPSIPDRKHTRNIFIQHESVEPINI